jgi:hypothetical protein
MGYLQAQPCQQQSTMYAPAFQQAGLGATLGPRRKSLSLRLGFPTCAPITRAVLCSVTFCSDGYVLYMYHEEWWPLAHLATKC